MGIRLFDQYTYLHFALGIIVFFWNISLIFWLILHTIFEIVENTSYGMSIINKYITWWPGGKPRPDAIINSVGDSIGAIIGWVSAYYIDKLGNKYGLYDNGLYDNGLYNIHKLL
jgi:Fe2+ transport system protein B